MQAQQIPVGNQDLRPATGNRARASLCPFERKSEARRRDLRGNGPIRVQFQFRSGKYARGGRMTSPRHISVLGREAVEILSPRDGGIYLDATFGAGGYSRSILAIAGTRVIGIDRDRSAVADGFDLVDGSDGRLTLVEDQFSNLADVCERQAVETVD